MDRPHIILPFYQLIDIGFSGLFFLFVFLSPFVKEKTLFASVTFAAMKPRALSRCSDCVPVSCPWEMSEYTEGWGHTAGSGADFYFQSLEQSLPQNRSSANVV